MVVYITANCKLLESKDCVRSCFSGSWHSTRHRGCTQSLQVTNHGLLFKWWIKVSNTAPPISYYTALLFQQEDDGHGISTFHRPHSLRECIGNTLSWENPSLCSHWVRSYEQTTNQRQVLMRTGWEVRARDSANICHLSPHLCHLRHLNKKRMLSCWETRGPPSSSPNCAQGRAPTSHKILPRKATRAVAVLRKEDWGPSTEEEFLPPDHQHQLFLWVFDLPARSITWADSLK